MLRTKVSKEQKVDAVLCSDWHLRETTPACRTDNFWEAQWEKVTFIAGLQQKYGCPIFHGGDLFHHWKPSPYLLSKAIQYLPKRFHTVYGQHDLPNHSLELANKSGIYTLEQASALQILQGTHFGCDPNKSIGSLVFNKSNRKVLIWHRLVWTREVPWPGCTDPTAESVLDKYDNFDLIVTGDNHKSFVVEQDGRLLVNPGSLTRQSADQADHKPKVYLWSADDNSVESVELPIKTGAVSREHIEHMKDRNERVEAFVKRLSDDWEVGLSFERNLELFAKANNVRASVLEIIYRAMEAE